MTPCDIINDSLLKDYLHNVIPPRPVKALITMLSCFSVLGLLGNSLVLYVYVRKRNKLSSTVFIIALAGIDLVTSAVGMPYTMVFESLDYQVSSDFSCKLYYFIITCTVPFSVFIMVAIAIDRYICICRPHSHVLDSVRARNCVFGLLGMAVAIGVITALFYGVYLDIDTIKKKNSTHDSLEIYTADNTDNVTNYLSILEFNSCNNCLNQSNNGSSLSVLFNVAFMDLYKTVCLNEHPLNESFIYTGHCLRNQILFSNNFMRTYQTIYSSSFLVCFSVVFVLYIMIYRSVLVRRSRRLAARSKTNTTVTQEISLTENQTMHNESPDKNIAMAELSNLHKEKPQCGSSLQKHDLQQQSKFLLQHQQSKKRDDDHAPQKNENISNGCIRDKYFLANIRTAIMLFVVTVAFVIAYLPSWLMAFKVIKFNVVVFYAYFSNHIVNPIIYAFMNPTFRRSLKGLLCRKKGRGM